MNVRAGVAALWRRLDGLAMAALAGFLGWLVLAGNYWMYLNPKFKPVTGGAAVVLAVLGLYAVWRPVTRPSRGRGLCYLALTVMIGLSEGGTQALSRIVDSDPFAACPVPFDQPAATPVPSRLTVGGTDYVPINTGELYDIAAQGHGPAFDRPYAMRGFASRDPNLDAKGEFVLYRLAVWCCFADATAVGFRVKVPEGAPLPAAGTWLVAYGRLVAAPPGEDKEYMLPKMAFSSIAPMALFAVEHLETAEFTPEEAAMFQWHDKEPYAF